MKNLIVLILTTALLGACSAEDTNHGIPVLQSQYISKADAEKQILSILNTPITNTRAEDLFDRKNITSSFTKDYTYYINGKKQNCDLYVFNIGSNDGYAAIISDIRTDQLLVLTDEGKLDEDDPRLNAIFPPINFLTNEPDTLDHDSIQLEPYVVYGDWTFTTVGYNNYLYPNPLGGNIMEKFGLTKVHWLQHAPYNTYCPLVDGVPAPTGCVATATAIFLSHFEYPSAYSGYSFNWTGMKQYPDANDLSTTYQNQVARLMEILGRPENLDVNYGSTASSSNLNKVPRTLDNLGFTAPGTFCDYNLDFILYDINFGKPVLVQGKPADGSDGHAWIIDAYS